MCRRIGCSGLTAGEAGAVGTIGLLGTPDAGTPEEADSSRRASLAIANFAWPVVIPLFSLPIGRRSSFAVRIQPLAIAEREKPDCKASGFISLAIARRPAAHTT
jgi:hypothetical protein